MAAERRAGFTLIELLVAMMISGLLVTVIFRLVQGQGRFVQVQSAREEVQQNARTTLDLIGAELRGIGPGGLVHADDHRIGLRVPRAWGVVCATSGTQLDLLLPADGDLSVSTSTTDSLALLVNVGTQAAPVWAPRVRVTGIGAAQSTCDGKSTPAGGARHTVSLGQAPSVGGAGPQVGSYAYLAEFVGYDVASSNGLDGQWIRRQVDDQNPQPMAGPVATDESGDPVGFTFRYFRAGSSTPETSLPLSSTALEQVDRIRLVVQTTSQRTLDGVPQVEHDSITITLRNR